MSIPDENMYNANKILNKAIHYMHKLYNKVLNDGYLPSDKRQLLDNISTIKNELVNTLNFSVRGIENKIMNKDCVYMLMLIKQLEDNKIEKLFKIY